MEAIQIVVAGAARQDAVLKGQIQAAVDRLAGGIGAAQEQQGAHFERVVEAWVAKRVDRLIAQARWMIGLGVARC